MVDTGYIFPDPETSDKQGLLAIGGDLCPQRIIQAYTQGIFPWFEPGCPILWWSPNPRLILLPDQMNVSRSLGKSLKKPFKLSIDTAFQQVITSCATCSGRFNNTWITHEMITAYTTLHAMGYAHSFEVWQDEKLVGGLYGISLGKGFFGESMFHKVTDASKIALYYLCQTLKDWEFDFIDCQMPTNHLLRLGATVISRKEFLHLLELTLKNPNKLGQWDHPLKLSLK
ncbi:leucyl/phenylalanyl-tRNA--protein transferase [Legionella bononiensis]|uniref:Leucyl/phenylalanyl-tRNA--protein transferase n=1 Tax=Legionella bononiensis TaxID=2793102 RepID=A0ABS1WCQ7_9GAMM|nr:leucyl/phenylalanyl-tRNA--protein transferase [Legionella bononiensis]MBL7479007.1 leucyl/phenylalanyl-tRNA--protein transferase [Legionella bononiensis]MBL7527140.1 leucyl/phenylalanyl-tRNA--protein transferase [Legionella bononiensis]MBL7562109.1 leucyl/phenylalanyl-tRNA--protein transferase [Legionella bononiensis]